MIRSALLLASLLLLPFGQMLRAATVTGNAQDYNTSPIAFAEWNFKPRDGTQVLGPQVTLARVIKVIGEQDGDLSSTLKEGTYDVTLNGSPIGWIAVPAGDGSYEIGDIGGYFSWIGTPFTYGQLRSDSTDTNALFLSSKLKAGTGISLAVTDTAGTNRQVEISATLGGTMTNVALTASELHVAGSPLSGVGGTITLALTNDLKAVEAITGTGLASRTADNTWALRSVAAGSGKVTVVNGNGVAGNPTVDLGMVAISDITGLQTELDGKQATIGATSDVTLSNLTVLGGVTISGSGANAVDSLVVTNSLQLQNATASRFLVTDALKNATNTVEATGTAGSAPVLSDGATVNKALVNTVINVQAPPYSATGDGVTDDSSAFIQAYQAAIAAKAEMFIPPGVYMMSVILTNTTTNNVVIRGSGSGSVIRSSVAGAYAITMNGSGGNRKTVFEDLTFDGESKTKNGITFSTTLGYIIFNRVRIQNHDIGVYKPIGDYFLVFQSCEIKGNNYGVYSLGRVSPAMHSGLDKVIFTSIESNAIVGYYIDDQNVSGGGQTVIQDSVIQGNPGFGVFARNLYGLSNPSLIMDRIWWESNGTGTSVTVTNIGDSTSETLDTLTSDFYLDDAKQVSLGSSKRARVQAVGNSSLLLTGSQLITITKLVDSTLVNTATTVSDQSPSTTLSAVPLSLFPVLPYRPGRWGSAYIPHRSGVLPRDPVGGGQFSSLLTFDFAVDSVWGGTVVSTGGPLFGKCNSVTLTNNQILSAGLSATIPDGSGWVLLTAALRNPTGAVALSFGGVAKFEAPASSVWKSYSGIAWRSTTAVQTGRDLFLTELSSTNQTVEVADVQVLAFVDSQDLIAYLDSKAYTSPKLSINAAYVTARTNFYAGALPGITTTWTNIISGVITQRLTSVGGVMVTNLTLP